jgi:hypothetical protein
VIPAVALCSFEGPRRTSSVSHPFPVAIARGKHLFPFRTEQLSPSAPMVLGSQGPGRVGRRRFLLTGRLRAARFRCCQAPGGRRRGEPDRRSRRGFDGAQANLWSLRRRSCAYSCRATPESRAMGMAHGCPLTRWPIGDPVDLRSVLTEFVLVDLPVDVVVVLEQQERTGQGERIARSARERGWSASGEHVFVTIRGRTDGMCTNIRTYPRMIS